MEPNVITALEKYYVLIYFSLIYVILRLLVVPTGTDKHTGRQTDGSTDGWTNRQIDRQTASSEMHCNRNTMLRPTVS